MTEKWDITNDKVVAFITDNGANIVKAVTNVYGKNKHMPCFAHTLNLVASKPFEWSRRIKNLLTAVKGITIYFKHSTNAADFLKKLRITKQSLWSSFNLCVLGAHSICVYQMELYFLSIRTICSII